MAEKTYSKNEMDDARLSAKLSSDVTYIKTKVDMIESTLEQKYVSVDQFTPVRNVVYGLVGLILTSVVVALISLIVIQK